MTSSDGPLDSQTWQTECKTAPLVIVQLCEHENQTLEAFVAVSRLYGEVWLSSGPLEFFTFSYILRIIVKLAHSFPLLHNPKVCLKDECFFLKILPRLPSPPNPFIAICNSQKSAGSKVDSEILNIVHVQCIVHSLKAWTPMNNIFLAHYYIHVYSCSRQNLSLAY